MQGNLDKPTICVVGLGYVGLPLAIAFAHHFQVIGFDNNPLRVDELKKSLNNPNLTVSTVAEKIKLADVVIIAVPTPVTKSKEPDLNCVLSAATTISQNLKKGATVVLESTVYPGVTEDEIGPILARSGLVCGIDFKIGYSPERINPGDEEHTVDKITKVVSGMDEETTELLAQLYGKVCKDVFRATNIKTAEAAKVIENIQRDLNIALVNELSLIFGRMGLDTTDVLNAASTKWNFQRYHPGLVGGHCIPVDPYYLVHKAEELGYHSQVILAGRIINNYMPQHVALMVVKGLNDAGKVIKDSKVLIMGLTYKENVPDTRETPAKEMIEELKEFKVHLYGYDPLLKDAEKEFHLDVVVSLNTLSDIDCVVLNVNHKAFSQISLDDLRKITAVRPVLIDIYGFYQKTLAEKKGFLYKRL